MKKSILLAGLLFLALQLPAQLLEFGVETVVGRSYATFRGDLAQMVGFSSLEISSAQVDSAFSSLDLSAPRWVRELFPGIRIDIEQEIARRLSRNTNSVRTYVRFKWFGGSFTVSDPRLVDKRESQKLRNQWKSVRLSLQGEAEALAEHLALLAAADISAEKPFFAKRYDLEAYVHLKKLTLGDTPLLEWGDRRRNSLDFELTPGFRFSADPSPVVNLGDIIFVKERITDLVSGGLLAPFRETTEKAAEGIQQIVFGNFNDPRVVPAFGWFARGEALANFGGGFTLVAGADLAVQQHTAIKGTKPMFLAYGFAGMRYTVAGRKR
jgi:hypothetical protein